MNSQQIPSNGILTAPGTLSLLMHIAWHGGIALLVMVALFKNVPNGTSTQIRIDRFG